MRKGIILICVVLLASLIIAVPILGGCAKAPATSAEPIKLGVLAPMSGWLGMVGPHIQLGTQTAADDINKAGGVLGRPVEIILRDDKSTPDGALTECSDLHIREGVDIIIGTVPDDTSVAVSAFAKENKVLAYFPVSETSMVSAENGHRYVFFVDASSYAFAMVSAAEVAKMPWTKIYNIHIDYPLSHDCQNYFWQEIGKLKPEVKNVGETWIGFDATEFSPIISAALASGADAIFTTMSGAPQIAFMAQAPGFGLFEQMDLFGPYQDKAEFTSALGDKWPAGLYCVDTCPWYIGYYSDKYPMMKRLDEISKEKIKVHTGTAITASYICVQAVCAAMKKAGTTDVEKVIDTLEGLTVDTPLGPLTTHDYDHRMEMPLVWVKGKYVPEFPGEIVGDILATYGGEAYQTKDQVMALRGK